MPSTVHLALSVIELTLAMLLFHRAMPASALNIGKGQAVMIWLLAFSLAMLGVGRLMTFFYGGNGHWVYTVGHITLIMLGALAYRRALRFGPAQWWEINGEGQGRHVGEPHI